MQMIRILNVKMIPPHFFPERPALVNLYFRNVGGDCAAVTDGKKEIP